MWWWTSWKGRLAVARITHGVARQTDSSNIRIMYRFYSRTRTFLEITTTVRTRKAQVANWSLKNSRHLCEEHCCIMLINGIVCELDIVVKIFAKFCVCVWMGNVFIRPFTGYLWIRHFCVMFTDISLLELDVIMC